MVYKSEEYMRHDLLVLDADHVERALRRILRSMSVLPPEAENWKKDILAGWNGCPLPAIRRRGRILHERVPVGFQSCVRYNGIRFRVAVDVAVAGIIKCSTPWDTASMPLPGGKVFQILDRLHKKNNGVDIGVWGSAALEIFTGMKYTDENSDLDIICRCRDLLPLMELYDTINQMEITENVRIDAEIVLPGKESESVLMKELFSGNTEDMLVRTGDRVLLIKRSNILSLFGNGQDGGLL